jgi:3'-phosphoadenosine 5'-phosphosulfate sulfotransferase (PAPS reductase)/FAD synthetase
MMDLLGLDLAMAHVQRGGELVLSYSGGKDSTAVALALRAAGLPFQAIFADTGWEHPETYRYLREVAPTIIGQPVVEVRAEVDLVARTEAHAVRIERRGGKSMTIEAAQELAALIRSEGQRKAAYAAEFEAELSHYSAMIRLCLHKIMFPAQSLRWCTEELKVWPIAEWLAENCDDPWIVQGIRRQESRAREAMIVRETMKVRGVDLDQEIWRPILEWSEADVIAAHHEAGIEPNRLYLRGASRVGCWPCIYARKSEIARLTPARVDFLARLERVVSELFAVRSDRTGSAYSDPSWFQAMREVAIPPVVDPGSEPIMADYDDGEELEAAHLAWRRRRDGYTDHKHACVPVVEMYEWSKTERGGRTMSLFAPADGCMKWGFCEHGHPPKVEE